MYFEPHESALSLSYYPGDINPTYWLSTLEKPVYMDRRYEEVPNSVAIPWRELRECVGKAVNSRNPEAPYAESTVGIMLACAALWLKPGDMVGIWGVDLNTGEEWAYQRPNAEYLIGFLRGKGIRVYIPPSSALTGTLCPDTGRYGGKEMDFAKWGVNWGLGDGDHCLYRDK